jgi:hypothetical protein
MTSGGEAVTSLPHPLAPRVISTDKAAMAQITSREKLEEWLNGRPADWAQVVAARSALRVLPYAFAKRVFTDWIIDHSNTLFRSLAISWNAGNFPTYPMIFAAASAEAAYKFNVEYPTNVSILKSEAYVADDVIIVAARAALAASKTDFVIRASAASVIAARRVAGPSIWANLDSDCRQLESNVDPATVAQHITRTELWPVAKPDDWVIGWDYATTRLLTLDPTYQVWIDWYDRRIEGHDAAFDIPGDTDRVHDKAILARLADATDEDFWGKGATYVNTTLQRWIDEARIDARIEEIVRKLRSGASAHSGAPEELAGRAALLDELDRLLGKSPQARHGIGGNYPPEPIDASEQSVALPEEMRAPLEAISTELEKSEPDALVVVEQVKLLRRVPRKLEKMASVAGDEFAKNVGGELGKRVVQAAFWLTLINQILEWLAPLIRSV